MSTEHTNWTPGGDLDYEIQLAHGRTATVTLRVPNVRQGRKTTMETIVREGVVDAMIPGFISVGTLHASRASVQSIEVAR